MLIILLNPFLSLTQIELIDRIIIAVKRGRDKLGGRNNDEKRGKNIN